MVPHHHKFKKGMDKAEIKAGGGLIGGEGERLGVCMHVNTCIVTIYTCKTIAT